MKYLAARWSSLSLLTIVLCLSLLLLPEHGVAGSADSTPPFRVRRVVIPPERVTLDLQRNKAFQVRTRQEFEQKLQRALERHRKKPNSPRLLKAQYRAKLEGNDLVGTGDWTIAYSGKHPGLLRLSSLGLALKNVSIQTKKHSDGSPAILGQFADDAFALFLPRGLNPDDRYHTYFDWSLRGEARKGALRYTMQIPACAASSLDLILPADCVVMSPGPGVDLSGPTPIGEGKTNLWQLHFGDNMTRVSFTIYRRNAADAIPSLMVTSIRSRQKITPMQVRADYDVTVQVHHNVVSHLEFEWTGPAAPVDVSAQQGTLKGWEIVRGKGNERDKLIVHLGNEFCNRRPPATITLHIRCSGPVTASGPWVSPSVRLREAVIEEEELTIEVHRDVETDPWSFGAFRLVTIERPPEEGIRMVFRNTKRTGPRPRTRLRPQRVQLSVDQRSWWKIEPRKSYLTSELKYNALKGAMHQLAVRLPGKSQGPWQLETVEVLPQGLLQSQATIAEGNGELLLLQLRKEIDRPVTVKLGFRSNFKNVNTNKSIFLSFPQVVPHIPPTTVKAYSGRFAISVNSFYKAEPKQTKLPQTKLGTLDLREQGPWGQEPVDFYYAYKAATLTGKIQLQPQRGMFQAKCVSDIIIGERNTKLVAKMELEPIVGATRKFRFRTTSPIVDVWQWENSENRGPGKFSSQGVGDQRSANIKNIRRLSEKEAPSYLSLLASRSVLGRLATVGTSMTSGTRPHQWWEVQFHDPIVTPQTIQLMGCLPKSELQSPGSDARVVEIPILDLVDAASVSGRVSVTNGRGTGTVVSLINTKTRRKSDQQLEFPNPKQLLLGETCSLFSYRLSSTNRRLTQATLRFKELAEPAVVSETCLKAHLTAYIQPHGPRLFHFRFVLRDWRNSSFPLTLPKGTQLLSARVAGRTISALGQDESDAGTTIKLPVDTRLDIQTFDLIYSEEDSSPSNALSYWRCWRRIQAPLPNFPVGIRPLSVRRTWRLPSGYTPLARSWVRQLPDLNSVVDPSPGQLLSQFWRSGDFLVPSPTKDLLPETWQERQLAGLLTMNREIQKQFRTPGVRLGEVLLRCCKRHPLAPVQGDFQNQDRGDKQQQGIDLVIDTVALEKAKLTPATKAFSSKSGDSKESFLSRLGLVGIPCPHGVLLTTLRQLQRWKAPGDTFNAKATRLQFGLQENKTDSQEGLFEEKLVPGSLLEQAVRQAIRVGRDTTGRFAHVMDWAHGTATSSEQSDLSTEDHLSSLDELGLTDSTSWTEWETIPGAGDDDTLTVVIDSQSLTLAWVLSVVVGGVLWIVCSITSIIWRFRVAVSWLATALVLALWTPSSLWQVIWFPGLLGTIVAFGRFYFSRPEQNPQTEKATPPSNAKRRAAVAALLLLGSGLVSGLCACNLFAGSSAEEGPLATTYTVFLVGDQKTPIQKQQVWVPQKLWQWIEQQLEGPQALPLEKDAVILQAIYKQKSLDDDVVRFEANYRVFCFTDNAILSLPLQKIRLGPGTTLQGEPAHLHVSPSKPEPGQNQTGYLVPIKGWKHQVVSVTVPFAVPIESNNGLRTLRWKIPACLQSQLVFASKGLSGLRVVNALGNHERENQRGSQVRVDLGAPENDAGTSTVRVLWRAPEPKHPVLHVTERYFWRGLSSSNPVLEGILEYDIESGNTDHVEMKIPARVHVHDIQIDDYRDSKIPLRVRSWELIPLKRNRNDAGQILRIHLNNSTTQKFQLYLKLLPGVVEKANVLTLQHPVPLGCKSRKGYLGFSLRPSLTLKKPVRPKLSQVSGEKFKEDWNRLVSLIKEKVTSAYEYSSVTEEPLSLRLVDVTEKPRYQQTIRWHLHPQHLALTADLKIPRAPHPMVAEWKIPPNLNISDVSGPGLVHWTVYNSRRTSRLQLWLSEGAKDRTITDDGTITLAGWIAANRKGKGIQTWNPPTQKKRRGLFVLPRIIPLAGAVPQGPRRRIFSNQCETEISISSVKGLRARPLPGMQHLHLKEDKNGLTYVTNSPGYAAKFLVQPVQIRPEVQVLTQGVYRDGVAGFETQIRYQMGPGKKTIRFEVHGWTGKEKLQLEAPWVKRFDVERVERDLEHWALEITPGNTRQLTIKLNGILSEEQKVLPRIRFLGDELVQQWVALRGDGFIAEETKNLKSVDSAKLPPWIRPVAVSNPARFWRVEPGNADWQLKFQTKSVTKTSPVELLSGTQSARLKNHQGWLHEGRYTLRATRQGHIDVAFPTRARVLAVLLDDRPVNIRSIGKNVYRLTLTKSQDFQQLITRWEFPTRSESLTKPSREQLRFKNLPTIPILREVYLPVGYRLKSKPSDEKSEPLSPAEADYVQAKLQHDLVVRLLNNVENSEAIAGTLDHVERTFFYYLQRGQFRSRKSQDSAFSQKRRNALREKFDELERDNVALGKKPDWEGLWKRAQANPRRLGTLTSSAEILQHGTPLVWAVESDEKLPPVEIEPTNQEQTRARFYWTELLVLALLAAWLLSLLPGIVFLIRVSWPEQFLGFLFLWAQLFGWSFLGVALGISAVSGRIVLLTLAIRGWLSSRRSQDSVSKKTATGTSSSGHTTF